MVKGRLAYIDIAKGILILFLLMGHALLFIKNEGIDDGFINGFQNLRRYLWTSYYMPAFFVITGFCSNFTKPFPTFIWLNFKTLKIPAMIFGTFLALVTMASHHTFSYQRVFNHVAFCVVDSGLWFLDALFIAKLIYWLILKLINNRFIISLLCLCVFLVGFILFKNNIPFKDYGNVCHAMMLTIFLFVGQELKNRQTDLQRKTLWGGAVFLSVLLYISLLDIAVPFITNKISIDWRSLIPFFILSVSGSVTIMGISKLIGNSKWLEYIGKNSLVFYMFNTLALNISVKLLVRYINSVTSFFIYLLILIMACLTLIVITEVLNTKHLKYSIGKF